MKLLFRAPNWLGDAVISRILLYNLKKFDITVICPKSLKDIFYDYNTICFENKKELLKLSLSLRKERYDIGMVVPLSLSSAMFMYITGAKRRIGFNFEMRGMFLTDKLNIPKDWKEHHTLDTQFLLIKSLGINPEIPSVYFEPNCKEQKKEENYAVISPFAAFGTAKEWEFERYLKIANMLHKEFGLKTVILGSKKDIPRLSAKKLPEYVISMVGDTTLMEAACIIKGASLFLGNDSGLTHLSASMGQNTIAIFGPTSPAWTSPLGKNAKYIWKPPKCAPCYRRECPIGTRECMKNISIEDVMKVAALSL